MENANPGHEVEFHGLKGAAHLNGTTGYLVKFRNEDMRWAVRCEDGEMVNAKPENLKRPETAQQRVLALQDTLPNLSKPAPTVPPVSCHGDEESLHEAVLDSFYKRRKGGVVVYYGNAYMVAVEFDGPFGNGGVVGEMVFADKNKAAQVVVVGRGGEAKALGRNFLLGETTEYIEATSESAFFSLLSRYKRRSSTRGLIDIKSGLKLYNTQIAK